MSSPDRSPRRLSDATLVDTDVLAAALRERADRRTDDTDEVLASEPVLSLYVHDEILKTLAKLSLSGAGPETVRNVAMEFHQLLGVTTGALRLAYRNLIEDFLPETEGYSQEQPPPQSPEDRRGQSDGDALDTPF